MLVTMYIVLLVVLFLIIIAMFTGADTDGAGVGMFFLIIFCLLIGLPAYDHNSDLVLMKHGNKLVEIRLDAIKEIDKQISSISLPSSLMNADSPVRSYVETKARYQDEITTRKEDIVKAELSIERRKMGFTAWTVWMLGDGKESK